MKNLIKSREGVVKMKNKKRLIIAVIILVIGAVGFGAFKAMHHPNYLYNQDGTIVDGRKELIEHLQSIEDETERKKQIDFCVEQNIITPEEAKNLY